MRPLNELINLTDPAWPLVEKWIKKARNKVEVLPANPAKANEALYGTQVTTRSPMGAIIFMTGGLLIDHGWIRILGSGHEKLNRSLPDWNRDKAWNEIGAPAPFSLIADDAIGGFFMLNGGGLGTDIGKVYYVAPDNLAFEPLELTYSEFLDFCFNNNLNEFYKGYRWTNWQEDIDNLPGDKGYHFLPPLWTKEGKDIHKSSRKPVPIEELYRLHVKA